MFSTRPTPERKRWGFSHLSSLTAHAVVLLVLCYHLPASFVKPTLITRGDRGTSVLLYVAPPAAEQKLAAQQPHPETARLHFQKRQPPKPNSDRTLEKNVQAQNDQTPVSSTPAGSVFGSQLAGDNSVFEVRPAIPMVFPDPKFDRSAIPAGLQGDVIVEMTIDEQGNVTETRVISPKPLGYGIEQTVVATALKWRFRPAMRDGVPIASKHDWRYHYPS